jgi:hypothetical protein
MSPAITAMCASAIKVTFRQKRQFFGIVILTTNGHELTRIHKAAARSSRESTRKIRHMILVLPSAFIRVIRG